MTLDIVVGRDGTVLDVSPRDGRPELARAAMVAIRTWHYRPTTVNRVPVEVATEVRLRFERPDRVLYD